MGQRTQQINAMRGFCREFGLHIPVGAKKGLTQMAGLIGDVDSALPQMLRPAMNLLLDQVRQIEARIEEITAQLKEVARQSAGCKLLMTVPGIGLMTGTGMTAAFAQRLIPSWHPGSQPHPLTPITRAAVKCRLTDWRLG